MIKACLIGKKLGHSYSPVIHAYFGYEYENAELEENQIEDFLLHGEFDCFNVTVPYKKAVMPFLTLSPEASELGAVNTIVRKDGVLTGYNTDYYGFSRLIEDNGVNVAEKKVVILGTGGASSVVQAYMKKKGANFVVVGRKETNNYDNLYLHYDADIIVNATPVGMYPNNLESPIDLKHFSNCSFVADLIYNPFKTAILLQADELGIKNANGLSMLVWQAIKASEYFCGKDNSNLFEKIYSDLCFKEKNIILVGMPSSGKSRIGKALAKKLGREFFDLDKEIEKREQKDIPTIFAEQGEEYFRKLESEILGELSKLSGKVIATGGGSVMGENAKYKIKQNSFVVYLKRKKISTHGRPLLASNGISAYKKLQIERDPVYTSLADVIVQNDGPVEKTINSIIGELYENNCY